MSAADLAAVVVTVVCLLVVMVLVLAVQAAEAAIDPMHICDQAHGAMSIEAKARVRLDETEHRLVGMMSIGFHFHIYLSLILSEQFLPKPGPRVWGHGIEWLHGRHRRRGAPVFEWRLLLVIPMQQRRL